MNDFQRVKEDHFKNLPFTRKQITDVYNTVTGESRSEHNLFFLQTIAESFDTGSIGKVFTGNGQIAFLHYVIVEHNSKFNYNVPFLGAMSFENDKGIDDTLKNVFLYGIDTFTNKSHFVISIFKFA